MIAILAQALLRHLASDQWLLEARPMAALDPDGDDDISLPDELPISDSGSDAPMGPVGAIAESVVSPSGGDPVGQQPGALPSRSEGSTDRAPPVVQPAPAHIDFDVGMSMMRGRGSSRGGGQRGRPRGRGRPGTQPRPEHASQLATLAAPAGIGAAGGGAATSTLATWISPDETLAGALRAVKELPRGTAGLMPAGLAALQHRTQMHERCVQLSPCRGREVVRWTRGLQLSQKWRSLGMFRI